MKLFVFLFLIIGSPAIAKNIVLYELNSVGNPATPITQQWIGAVNKTNFSIEYRAGLGCAGRNSFVNDTRPSMAIVFAGRIWGSLDRGEDTCVIDINQFEPISVYEYYNKICTSADSNLSLVDLLDKNKKLKIGIQAVANPHQYWVDDLNRQYGTNHRTVTSYTNSGDVSRGVLSRDVDFGIFSGITAAALLETKKIKCIATTDSSKENSFVKLFPKINKVLNGYNGSYIVLAKNLSDNEIKKIRQIVNETNEKSMRSGATNLIAKSLEPDQMKVHANAQINEILSVTKTMKNK